MKISECLKLFNLIRDTRSQTRAGKLLIENQKTLSIAESCTGGLLSSLMTDVSGSSDYIHANFVTYANEAKTKYLDVRPDTLEKYGAVSVQTADEMVKGLLKNTGSDFAIATTGIAGPTGGSKEKPVGLVFIGIGSKSVTEGGAVTNAVFDTEVHKFNVNPNYPRILVKYLFAKHAAALLADYLERRLK